MLLLLFFAACDRPKNSPVQNEKGSGFQQVEKQVAEVDIAGDPQFVMPRDTNPGNGPQSITRSVFQDQQGTIWMASWEGIVRAGKSVNGEWQFTNITMKERLKRFHVFSILEDKSGYLWFGMIGGGVYRYDTHYPNEQDQSSYFTQYTTADGLAGNKVMCMLEEKNGNIWFGTENGVSCYNGSTFSNYSREDGLPDNFVSSIMQDISGKIWVATNGGVCIAAPALSVGGRRIFTGFTNRKEGWSFHNVRYILEDRSAGIWIAATEGLWKFETRTGELKRMLKNSPAFIYEDRAGIFWLNAGGSGSDKMVLYRYDASSDKERINENMLTEIVVNDRQRPPFLNQVFGIMEDKDGFIWFGTASGVCRYDPKAAEKHTGTVHGLQPGFHNFSGSEEEN